MVLGWLVFAAGKRLNVRAFFRATSVLLILFAAGLVAQAVHEFQEAALLPALVEQVWDVNPILDEHSGVGAFLKALLGYNGNPSLLEGDRLRRLRSGRQRLWPAKINLNCARTRAQPPRETGTVLKDTSSSRGVRKCTSTALHQPQCHSVRQQDHACTGRPRLTIHVRHHPGEGRTVVNRR